MNRFARFQGGIPAAVAVRLALAAVTRAPGLFVQEMNTVAGCGVLRGGNNRISGFRDSKLCRSQCSEHQRSAVRERSETCLNRQRFSEAVVLATYRGTLLQIFAGF